MGSWIFVAIACNLIGGLQAQTNYCVTSYCSNNRVNIGCNPPGFPGGAGCNGLNPVVITLNSTIQSLILSEHNSRRSQLALGQLQSFEPATRMATVTWDTELANQAGNNARNCTYQHDSCRNTAVYAWAGQNLALTQFYGTTYTVAQLVTSGINSWWSEFNVTTQAQLKSYPSGYTGPAIGHFTQMASDQTARIGCAMQHWKQGPWLTYYFVCNYAVTNVIGRPTYKPGPVGSACSTGLNPSLPGLCSVSESINPVPNPRIV
uniref:Venom allergen-1 n=1 Tax=Anopheles epiroticus TaxID=199890 RepID=A0A182PV17_9DIPT